VQLLNDEYEIPGESSCKVSMEQTTNIDSKITILSS